MQALNEIFATIDGFIGGSTWFVYLLIGTGDRGRGRLSRSNSGTGTDDTGISLRWT